MSGLACSASSLIYLAIPAEKRNASMSPGLLWPRQSVVSRFPSAHGSEIRLPRDPRPLAMPHQRPAPIPIANAMLAAVGMVKVLPNILVEIWPVFVSKSVRVTTNPGAPFSTTRWKSAATITPALTVSSCRSERRSGSADAPAAAHIQPIPTSTGLSIGFLPLIVTRPRRCSPWALLTIEHGPDPWTKQGLRHGCRGPTRVPTP
jgi:hypothetical protein